MRTTPKLFLCEKKERFLIKNLTHIANGIGQTLQVFYPDFPNKAKRNYYLIHRLIRLATQCAALGYFIISMHRFTALDIALVGAH